MQTIKSTCTNTVALWRRVLSSHISTPFYLYNLSVYLPQSPIAMATATPNLLQPPNFTCVKSLSESSALTSIPSTYTFTTDPNQLLAFEPQHSIPIIDFSLLTSGDPDQRYRAIQDLDQACLEWGFFMVIATWNSIEF